ncbi:P-loop containing nucleoside triphosphate hydrolase protein [Xylariaceae sp. FL1272]|nr:P-loop containing nucleoside triphosphate hydrolase protein [Xylariaceae sp. FL1272]
MSVVRDGRSEHLDKCFNAFIRGRSVSTVRDAEVFFESICSQPSPATCLEKLFARREALAAVSHSIRLLTTNVLICKRIFPFIIHLTHPDCAAICGGQLLEKLIEIIADHPTTLNSMLQLYLHDEFIDKDANTEALASLCFHLVDSPSNEVAQEIPAVSAVIAKKPFTSHHLHRVREFGYRIQKALSMKYTTVVVTGMETPEGRHDNDFGDFRKISIFPTPDELSSTTRPFYRRAVDVMACEPTVRSNVHIDNQYRLLREDMLAELRDDLKAVSSPRKGRRSPTVLGNLTPFGLFTGDQARGQPCALLVGIGSGLGPIQANAPKARRAFLKDNPQILRHQSFGAVCQGTELVGFAFVVRDIDKLSENPPVIGLQFTSVDVIARVLTAFHAAKDLRFIIVDTPVFAYEPVLQRMKDITGLTLENRLLGVPDGEDGGGCVEYQPSSCVSNWIRLHGETTGSGTNIRVDGRVLRLDEAQHAAVLKCLQSSVAIVQGPPGTGKSFVGALVAKLLLDDPSTRMLAIAYTNHALDQFMEEIMEMGVSTDIMTRLGSKYTTATKSLLFKNQFQAYTYRRSSEANIRLFRLKDDLNETRNKLDESFQKLNKSLTSWDLLMYLEFSEDPQAQQYWNAFQIPSLDSDFTLAGSRGNKMQPDFLINSWRQGRGPGMMKHYLPSECFGAWKLGRDDRQKLVATWASALRKQQIETVRSHVTTFNTLQREIDTLYNEARCDLIKTKRLVGSTTTAAAKYSALIKATRPTCVLVEEAGEILEAHILTALGPSTKQLILIGDHKQLRPKCKNYGLTVEKGDGYDLNRSMFERLILQGHEYATLSKQHRMAPEISQLIRALTYPSLQDGDKTFNRPAIRGIPARVAFINHDHPEVEFSAIQELRDGGAIASKQNRFEAEMVLNVVRYMGQQGYKTENIVILTPYLGQLRLLREMLSKNNDPLLSDLDSYELRRAGLLTAAAAKVEKGQIRLATIDNYQGEESDIIITSLTRSNSKGEIGFMKAPERLNVLLSRARNCLIMIGNMETLMKSPQGKETWLPFFSLMKQHNYLQDGFWVRCEQHPERTAMLSKPDDFSTHCPDGGCSEPCGAELPCGVHTCQRRCHRLLDHSNTPCDELIEKICAKQHKFHVTCGQKMLSGCETCLKEEEAIRRRAQKHLEIEKARLIRQAQYQRELKEIQDEIAHQRQILKDDQKIAEQQTKLEQERLSLETLRETVSRKKALKQSRDAAKPSSPGSTTPKTTQTNSVTNEQRDDEVEAGSAREEWEQLKTDELAQSDVLDELMKMIGLESIKRALLNIKSKVDTATRQGISTSSERFGCSLLGNPGTGKTTVARLYARFLTSMGVIAGACFKETSGSKLANMGVSGTEQLVQEVVDDGGGVIFIDEAYQLSSGNSPGGRAVLDYLLAEVENLNSKVVFILAGYAKQMETFFAHNPGFPSRFPHELKFDDYTDDELLRILQSKINAKYSGRMNVEDGTQGLYCRIVARRIGRGRGKEGFGNARAVENMVAMISQRQSERLRRQRRQRENPDDFLFTKRDLIGPEPSSVLDTSAAWKKLQDLIGLSSVKNSVGALVDTLKDNYLREVEEQPIIEYNLNKVFLGNPGTGKTTVAKLYGQVLVDLGMLSNGEVVIKNPSDFVGGHLGQSEQQTKGILASTKGKVLVIDEAYGLYGGNASQGGGGFSDPYKTAVVDTIVAEIQSVPGEDRCVLLLGYKEQMEEMFQNRVLGVGLFDLLEAVDFDEDFDRLSQAETNVALLFKDTIGSESIVTKLQDYQHTVQTMKAMGLDPQESIPFTFLFRGPPGTGKTTTARKIGKVYYDMGFLAQAEVIDCSASDLIGQFVGQTGPKVRQLFDKALGRVLLIDEAYRLAEGHFAKEALDEIVDAVTKERYKKRLIIILAGYENDINRLLSVNPGLTSRFPETIDFLGLPPEKCFDLLAKLVEKRQQEVRQRGSGTLDASCFDEPTAKFKATCCSLFEHISKQPNWASGRDIETLAESMFRTALKHISTGSSASSPTTITISEKITIAELQDMLQERRNRGTAAPEARSPRNIPSAFAEQHSSPPVIDMGETTTKLGPSDDETTTEQVKDSECRNTEPAQASKQKICLQATRDAGVSDEVWNQLQLDAAEEVAREQAYQAKLKAKREAIDDDLRDQIVKELLEEEERKKKEAEAKAKLQAQGRCPVGYQWIRQSGGWRCAGGSHFVSEGQLL